MVFPSELKPQKSSGLDFVSRDFRPYNGHADEVSTVHLGSSERHAYCFETNPNNLRLIGSIARYRLIITGTDARR
jgi:hypothetical protein